MKSCLIVENSKVVRMVVRKILDELGFETREAADADEAMAACRDSMPDVILLDRNAPVTNGRDFMQELRQAPGGDAAAVVFCSAENGIEHIRAALESGADEYIMKPFDGEIVRSKFALIGLI